jgi:uncharacterized protein involved in outer membrane biogenesis
VRVAFLPLLKKRMKVIDIRVEGPYLDIVKNRQGRINIALAAGGAAPQSGVSALPPVFSEQDRNIWPGTVVSG